MRGLVVVVCIVVAGCDVVWRLDKVSGTEALDGPIAIDASGGDETCPFGPRIQISAGGGNHDPQLTDDGLELFFVRGASGTYDIWHAIRSDTQSPFPMGAAIGELNSVAEETDPAISQDGNTIIFKSTRNSMGNRAYQATRFNRGDVFTTPILLSGLPANVSGLDLSADGLTAYVDDGGKLDECTRPAVASTTFTSQRQISLDRPQFPSVSADGLELYYNGAGVLRRKRSTTNDPFDGASTEQIDDGAADPDLTFDGTRLVMTGSGIIYVRERCVP